MVPVGGADAEADAAGEAAPATLEAALAIGEEGDRLDAEVVVAAGLVGRGEAAGGAAEEGDAEGGLGRATLRLIACGVTESVLAAAVKEPVS